MNKHKYDVWAFGLPVFSTGSFLEAKRVRDRVRLEAVNEWEELSTPAEAKRNIVVSPMRYYGTANRHRDLRP